MNSPESGFWMLGKVKLGSVLNFYKIKNIDEKDNTASKSTSLDWINVSFMSELVANIYGKGQNKVCHNPKSVPTSVRQCLIAVLMCTHPLSITGSVEGKIFSHYLIPFIIRGSSYFSNYIFFKSCSVSLFNLF